MIRINEIGASSWKQKTFLSLKLIFLISFFFMVAFFIVIFCLPYYVENVHSFWLLSSLITLFCLPVIYFSALYTALFLSSIWSQLNFYIKLVLGIYFIAIPLCFSFISDQNHYLWQYYILAEDIGGNLLVLAGTYTFFSNRVISLSKSLFNILFISFTLSFFSLVGSSIRSYHPFSLMYPKEHPGLHYLQLDNIKYYADTAERLALLRDIHSSLPKHYKKLDVDLRMSHAYEFNKVDVEGVTFKGLFNKSRILINPNYSNSLEATIFHELSHAYQGKILGVLQNLWTPCWKLEGHAVFLTFEMTKEKSGHDSESLQDFLYRISGYLLNHKKDIPFGRFGNRSNRVEYDGAYAQAWYYLDYLGISENDFFSNSTKLAPWAKVKDAWDKEHQDLKISAAQYIEKISKLDSLTDSEKNSLVCYKACLRAGADPEQSALSCLSQFS